MKLHFHDEVSAARHFERPIVALESTVIAHGLPYPKNIETAKRMEQIIRDSGAVPATIAIFGGKICVGLNEEQIEQLATDKNIRKISRRDLPVAVAKKLNGATTVATTTLIAHAAGIQVFATGGIGGVHRGYSNDVSSDLPELARTPMIVVCSGAKSVLDLPATREWLETYGIPVLGWQWGKMAAFYSRNNELPIDERVENGNDVAAIALARDELGLKNSILVTVPVPEQFEIPAHELEDLLGDAVHLASELKITGKEITPFLLSQMSEKSGGRTLSANIALLENNARVAGEIAMAISN
jgi:pseudouridine-5'-phosphate glycosidase